MDTFSPSRLDRRRFSCQGQDRGIAGPLAVDDRRSNRSLRFQITHDYMSVMLVVRRSSVTIAVQTLEAEGPIRATREATQHLYHGDLPRCDRHRIAAERYRSGDSRAGQGCLCSAGDTGRYVRTSGDIRDEPAGRCRRQRNPVSADGTGELAGHGVCFWAGASAAEFRPLRWPRRHSESFGFSSAKGRFDDFEVS